MSLYPVEPKNLFENMGEGEVQLYKIDWIEKDAEGHASFQISYFRYLRHKDKSIAINGVSVFRLESQDLIRNEKIEFDKFFAHFLWIEVLSITVLALRYASNIEEYGELREVISKISIGDRFKICKRLWGSGISSRYKNVLELRNQLAHNLDLHVVQYGGKKVWPDKSFDTTLKKDISSTLESLALIMRKQDKKIEKLKIELLEMADKVT